MIFGHFPEKVTLVTFLWIPHHFSGGTPTVVLSYQIKQSNY